LPFILVDDIGIYLIFIIVRVHFAFQSIFPKCCYPTSSLYFISKSSHGQTSWEISRGNFWELRNSYGISK